MVGRERENEAQRDQACGNGAWWGCFLGCPRPGAWWQLGIERQVGLLSLVELEPGLTATLQVKMWQFVLAKQET